jgi:hypothetical protein
MPDNEKPPENQRKTIAVSSIGMSVNDNFAQVTFGLELLGKGPPGSETIQEEVCLVMTPRTMKVFSAVLANSIATLEKLIGEIPIAASKLKELQDPSQIRVQTVQPLPKQT